MKVKKLLLIFLIVSLFVAAVLTTVFLFFLNRKKADKTVDDMSNYVVNLEKSKRMSETRTLIAEIKSSDSRFSGIAEIIDNLDDIAEVLITYSADLNFKFENQDLHSKITEANNKLTNLHEVVKEYNIKKDSLYFNKKLGANDLLSAVCSYLCAYADLTSTLISVQSDKILPNSDLRCSVFDLYSRVVKTTFSVTEIDESTNLRNVSVLSNINLMNEKFALDNGQLQNLAESSLSLNASKFCINYNSTEKDTFASQLFSNVKDEITLTENSNVTERASYYFREIYGV